MFSHGSAMRSCAGSLPFLASLDLDVPAWFGGQQVKCVRETEILVEQQPPQGVFVCDHAGHVINKFSLASRVEGEGWKVKGGGWRWRVDGSGFRIHGVEG